VERALLVSIVDDDASVCRAVGRLIGSMGFDVHEHSSAEAFLASSDVDFARCLILDVGLPGMDGFQLQQQLSRWKISIPIIFITGHGDDVRRRALDAGALDVLRKPLSEAALVDDVAAALEVR
jgi:FixJ family two-component response regulator